MDTPTDKEVQALLSKRDELRLQIADTMQSINDAKLQKQALDEEITSLETTRDADKVITDNLEQRRTDLETSVSTLDNQQKGLTADVAILTTQLSSIKTDIAAFIVAAPAREQTERDRVRALIEAEMSDATTLLAKTVQKQKDAEKAREEANATVTKLTNDQNDLIAQNSSLEATRIARKSSLDALEANIASEKKLEDNLTGANSALTATRDSLQAQIADLSGQISSLTDEVNEKTLESANLDSDILAKKTEYKSIEARLFTVGARETALTNREAFIRAKFDEAGVPYQ